MHGVARAAKDARGGKGGAVVKKTRNENEKKHHRAERRVLPKKKKNSKKYIVEKCKFAMASSGSEFVLPGAPTDGVTRVIFSPESDNLLVSSWDSVSRKQNKDV